MQLPQLPIQQIVTELRDALSRGSAVLAAPPGSGKTTIVPLSLLDEPWLVSKKILMLEPRRLAARAAARRMAALLGEKVGQTVGYQVRFDRKIGRSTRIEVLTEGVLTRRIQDDAELSDVALVVFDEFHERSIHADLALALCLDLLQLKEDLRLLIMSATLDTAPIAKLLGGVPIITGQGKSHDVEIEYLNHQLSGRISDVTARGVKRVLEKRTGDLLVFLPGIGEIKEVQRQLRSAPACRDIVLCPLFGDLSAREQDRAMLPDPQGRRRVVLSTSIAETSLTLEGIEAVVDSGWSRRPQFDPGNGLSRLITLRVSKAAAHQRAGRAGRTGPGYCLRLWSKNEQYSLAAFHPPEILSSDLTGLVLDLALWGVNEPDELLWLDPPRHGAQRQARQLLCSLGAINSAGQITEIGRELATLPLHPRLGYMLLMAKKLGQGPLACDIAAILSERDIMQRSEKNPPSELRLRLELLDIYRRLGQAGVLQQDGDPVACKYVEKISSGWRSDLGIRAGRGDLDETGNILVYAYPDRIAQKRRGRRGKFLLASGRGAGLAADDHLAIAEYLVVPRLDGGKKEGRIFLAEPIDPDALKRKHGALFSRDKKIYWDDPVGKVATKERLCIGNIVVEENNLAEVEGVEIQEAMLQGIRQRGLHCLPWNKELRQLQTRVNCLRIWQPEVKWPDLDDSRLLADLDWLKPYITGMSRVGHLQQINLKNVFLTILGWDLQQKIERDAPSVITVPSGSKIHIVYQKNKPPVLAVRIQEMFGLLRTPVICQGKVPLLLHLLSPAQRPVQITSDLEGFWQRSYPEVKKELQGRYPKHFWPENPQQAKATRGLKRRREKEKKS